MLNAAIINGESINESSRASPPLTVAGYSRTIYRARLVDSAGLLPELVLPISSWQARRNNGSPSYIAAVIPNPAPYLTGISARLGGFLGIDGGTATVDGESYAEIARVVLGDVRYDLGARSGSLTLSGHATYTASTPMTRTLMGISYKAVTNGVRNIRCEPDMYLAPGDTADVGGGETFTVGSISYAVNPRQAIMEVQEAE